MKIFRWVVAVVLAGLLAACSGGSGGGGAATTSSSSSSSTSTSSSGGAGSSSSSSGAGASSSSSSGGTGSSSSSSGGGSSSSSSSGGTSSSSSSSGGASSSSSSSGGGIASITIQENEDGFCRVDGAVENEHAGFTGAGYANTINALGNGISWRVNTPEAGSYTLEWRYANATGDRPAEVVVNGDPATTLSFTATGAFTSWNTESVVVDLEEGNNDISLISTVTGGLPNIDYMKVDGNDPQAVACAGGSSSSSSSGGGGSTFNCTPGGSASETPPTPDFSLVGFATWNGSTYGGGTTGGAGGDTVTVSTGTALQAAIDGATGPRTIFVDGTITPANSTGLSKFDIKDVNNISVIGVGTSGRLSGIGIKINRASNIIVRNLTIHEVNIGDKDAISIEGQSSGATPTERIWIDHNELYGSLSVNKDFYDGLLDSKSGARYITISWNYLHDSWKSSLHGHTDNDGASNTDRFVTFHHNRFENLNSRVPLFRWGFGHVFNNYYKDIIETGANSRMGANLRIENNHFENAKNPILYKDSPVQGFWDARNNIFENVTWVPQSSPYVIATIDGDCNSQTTTYDPPYSYTPNNVHDVRDLVVANAGVGIIEDGSSSSSSSTSSSGGSSSSSSSSGGGSSSSSSSGSGTWSSIDIGSANGSTTVGENNDSVTLSGRGKFESGQQTFRFIHAEVTGNFTITARLDSVDFAGLTSNQGRAGLLLSPDLNPGTANTLIYGSVSYTAATTYLRADRLAAGSANTSSIAPSGTGELYLKLIRDGNTYQGFVSLDGGLNYTASVIRTFTDTLPETVYVGLMLSSSSTSTNATATFSDVRVLDGIGNEIIGPDEF